MRAPAEDARDVFGGLALADLDGVGAQVDGVPSQLEEPLRANHTSALSRRLLFAQGWHSDWA